MSDAELRACERDLSLDPADLDVRRRHARLLERMAEADRALSALDLAWRLGAEEVFDELSERLEERAISVGPLDLRYIPAGPFVMGSDDFDPDGAPAHLVFLSAFYVLRDPLTYGALRTWEQTPEYLRDTQNTWAQRFPYNHGPPNGRLAAEHVTQAFPPPGLAGHYALQTEAQWERVYRANLLRPDGSNPYGVGPVKVPEWTQDAYAANYYDVAPRYDPPGPPEGEHFVVRGIPQIPTAHYASYRESADAQGRFSVRRRLSSREVPNEAGIRTRLVFLPA